MGFWFFWEKNEQSICSNEAISYHMVKGKTKMVMPKEERDSSIIWVEKNQDEMEKSSRTIFMIYQ